MSSLSNIIRGISGDRGLLYQSYTPHDTNETPTGAVLVGVNGSGTAGNIVIEQRDGSTFTLQNVQPGASFPISPVKILATGTTSTNIYVGLA